MSVYVYEARYIGNPNTVALTESPPAMNLQGESSRTNAMQGGELTGPDETINDPNSPVVNIVEGVPMSTTRNLFHFDFCEFNMAESSHLDTVSNAAPLDVGQKFGVKYHEVEEENMYTFWELERVADGYIKQFDQAAQDFQNDGIDQGSSGGLAGVAGAPPSAEGNVTMDKASIKGKIAAQAQSAKANLIEQGNKKVGALKKNFAGKVNAKLNDAKAAALAKVDRLKKTWNPENLFGRLEDQAIEQVNLLAVERINNLGLGNMYGFSPYTLLGPDTVGKITSPAWLIDAGRSIVNGTHNSSNDWLFGGSPSLTNTTGKPPQENMGDGSPSLMNTDPPNSPNENIFNP